MKLSVQLGQSSYDIILKEGALRRAGMLANLGRRVMVVSDEGVPPAYVQAVARQCAEAHRFVLPAGEEAKDLSAVRDIQRGMMQAGFGRGDAVAVVGGGVACDVGGFAAASYLGGVSLLQFPTTTMAQAGVAVSGRAALHLDGARDVLAVRHWPEAVIIDTGTLSTLPPRHYNAGLAAVLQVALVGSDALLAVLEDEEASPADTIEKLLFLTLQYRAELAARDPDGRGEGRLPCLGQAVGEALAAVARQPGGLLYGEALALGALAMIESRSLQRRMRRLMRRLGLPVSCRCDEEAFRQHLWPAKEGDGGRCTLARVKQPGRGYLETIDIDELALLGREVLR